METLGTALFAVGGIAALIGGIWLLVLAFQESPLWGIGCLLVPFVGIIFAAQHWSRAGKPFLIQVGGLVLMIIGMVLGPDSLAEFMKK